GGFSELFKNRIVVPFDGSYDNFYHVIGHELAHIFEFQMFYRSRLATFLGALGEFRIPLWVLEGFAEFQSGWVNVNSDIFMRDLLLNDRLVPLDQLNDEYGYLAYREGESFFKFVEEVYGRHKVYDFMRVLRNKRNLGATFVSVFGRSQARVGEEWSQWLKRRYWPQVGKLEAEKRMLHRLTDHVADGSVYNTASAISPSGTKVAMISDRSEYADCYVISALDGKVLRRLVKGGRSGGFENMHLIKPGIAWSPDERMVAVVATSVGIENISIVEYPSGRVRRRVQGELDGVYAPRFSPDGKRLAFVGVKNGYSDIYVVRVEHGEPERLTFDIYEDIDPAFSPSGDTVVFVSDRPDPGQPWLPGRYAVWLRDGDGSLHRITERRSGIASPLISNSGRYLLYVAADSAINVYVYSLERRCIEKRTDFLGAVSHLSVSQDDRLLALTYFSNSGWDVAVIHDPLESIPPYSPHSPDSGGDSVVFDRAGIDPDFVRKVGVRLSLDYAAGAASYSAGGGGLSGVLSLAFSDMLGNHRFDVYTDIYGDIINSDAVFQYMLLPYRTDFGFALFQYGEYPYYVPAFKIVERMNRGGQVLVSYPLNRFLRVESGLTFYASQVTIWHYNYAVMNGGWYVHDRWCEHTILGGAAAVLDNTIWTEQGPVRGTRARAEVGSTFLSDSNYRLAYSDFRSYLRISSHRVLATRLLIAGRFGDVPGFSLGGEYVRGYGWKEFWSATGPGILVSCFELRYPFIERFKLAFPLPIEFRGIGGVAFLDAGVVIRRGVCLWNQGRLLDLKVGAGVGLRFKISLFLLKFDLAKPLSLTDDSSWKVVFGLGSDF
ncbi:MAG: BamA/TamA family outer membrane protein, partial [candidate division WOR-3 bacterium]